MFKTAALFLVPALALCAPSLAQDARIMLHYGAFDPIANGEPVVPAEFAARAASELFVVQFTTNPTQADREALRGLGGEVEWYAPHDAYVVRAPAARRAEMSRLPGVRWVGPFHPAYKLEPALLEGLRGRDGLPAGRYVIVLVDPRRDEAALVAAVQRLGGSMWRYAGGNLLIEADLTAAQLAALVHENTVLWVQKSTPIEVDMDNARIQGGANYLESVAGYTGKGVRGHIMEGIYSTHPEFAANAYRTAPVAVFSGTPTSHGNATFGEVFSHGVVAQARGLCPDGQGYFTDYDFIINTAPQATGQNSRYGVVQEITDPSKQWQAMFETASWGYTQIVNYDARSAEMDWIIHQFDIPICQSQSNTGNQRSRPQAWAKNIISVGALNHLNTANPNDDTQSGTSMGPATDGRIKPDLCGYYDLIYTTNGATSYQSNFGGTSGATPMVCGHVGLTLEMFTQGDFGYPAAPGWQNRFPYKPHFTTAKALIINTARQYDPAINGAGAASRYRQGWGFPSVQDMYDLRNNMLVADELDVLTQGQTRTYLVEVKPSTPLFRATMVYSDLAAAPPFSNPHRVNNLDVRVRAPNGAVYYGNTGMVGSTTANNYTAPGGAPNDVDTVENVFVRNPQYGVWQIDVSAPLIALDQHLETGTVDADFALVASGIGGGRDLSGPVLDVQSAGPGNLSLSLTNNPSSYVEGYVLLSLSTSRPLGTGNALGLEADGLTAVSAALPATTGGPLHFAFTTNGGVFPNAPYVFPAAVAQAVQGLTLDAVAFYLDGTGANAASNVDRVTVQ